MPTVQISAHVKALIERQVAEGAAADEGAFIEAAVRNYTDEIADNDDALLAAAQEGIEASRRGDFVTISTPEEQEAVWKRIWARAMELGDDMRAERTPVNAADQR